MRGHNDGRKITYEQVKNRKPGRMPADDETLFCGEGRWLG
jgi:hypothetical protein